MGKAALKNNNEQLSFTSTQEVQVVWISKKKKVDISAS